MGRGREGWEGERERKKEKALKRSHIKNVPQSMEICSVQE